MQEGGDGGPSTGLDI